ncbi:MAG: hypothetical protein M0Z95_11690 [Actinomycetota bacterium]|jgi:nuclear transport factor 2 (NTF2) superfamily protein|nr:hypothetical protein [Actinomycetota bacterium]
MRKRAIQKVQRAERAWNSCEPERRIFGQRPPEKRGRDNTLC